MTNKNDNKKNKRGNNRSRRNRTQPCLVFILYPNPQPTPNSSEQQVYNNMEISNLENSLSRNEQQHTKYCDSYMLETYSQFPSHHTDKHIHVSWWRTSIAITLNIFMTSLFIILYSKGTEDRPFLASWQSNPKRQYYCAFFRQCRHIKKSQWHSTETHQQVYLHRWEGRLKRSSSGSVVAGWSL